MGDGASAARARAVALDGVLQDIFEPLAGDGPTAALAAVGGYGRAELSPHSDVDLIVLTERSRAPGLGLKEVLYPLWDAGFRVGHAVVTPAACIDRADNDLDAATSLLTGRFICGTRDLFDELTDRRRRWTRKNAKKLIRRIKEATVARHRSAERAGWSLAPDIKEDVGGLRDVHCLGWLAAIVEEEVVDDAIITSYELLMAVREALHAELRRPGDRIHMEIQPDVATRLGLTGADAVDELMAQVHSAARAVEHRSEVAREALVERVLGGPRRSGSTRLLGGGVRINEGLLLYEGAVGDLGSVMRLLATHSSTGRRLSRTAVQKVRRTFEMSSPGKWDRTLRAAFMELLKGPHAPSALELLDHTGGWEVLMPEWKAIRGRAQHDPYHRYTVDGHSFMTVAEVTRALGQDPVAASALEEADGPDVPYLAALLHDVGKGSGEDHSVAGERIARSVCARMGIGNAAARDVVSLVRHHLLLADTATRRDLDDGSVIEATAKTIGDARRLRHLYLLTVADGKATGQEGWSEWKAALVRELYRKTLIALETGEIPARSDVVAKARQIEAYEPSLAGRAEAVLSTLPPSYLESAPVPDMVDEIRLLLQTPHSGEVRFRVDDTGDGDRVAITICTPDRPGTLARAAGVMALNRISVLRAQAYATSEGFALERFIVTPEKPDWSRFEADLQAAYSGRLAVEAHVERKARDYKPTKRVVPEVRVVQDASSHSTVVEVRSHDALGLLYAITAGISDLDLDIHVAKIDTLGSRVVDVFYVRTLWGSKLDAEQAAEVERSVSHRVGRLFD